MHALLTTLSYRYCNAPIRWGRILTVKYSPSLPVWIFAGLFFISLVPFALCSPMPLSDYPNHVARMHIIAHLGQSAELAKYYSVKWEFIPNLAMDIMVPLMIPALSAEAASMVFAAFSMFLISSGAIVLHRKLYGRWSLVPFASFLLLYNRHFLWGFLNYLFSVGLGLWMLAAHIHYRDRSPLFRISLFTVLAVALMVSHLHAFASYAVLVGGYEISVVSRNRNKAAWRSLMVSAAQFVLPVILFLALSSTTDRAGEIKWSSPMDKLYGLLDMVNNYSLPLDVATFLILAGLVALGLATRRLSIHRDMRLPLALLFIIYLCLPRLMFASFGADRRLLVMATLAAVASMSVRIDTLKARTALVTGVALLFFVRMGVIAANWVQAQRVYQPILAALEQLPRGARVVVLVGGDNFPYLANPPLDHVPNMAVITRDAYLNTLFAEPGKQVLRVVYNSMTPFSVDPSQTFRMDKTQVGRANPFPDVPLDRFDYLLLINQRYFVRDYPPRLRRVFERDIATLFKIAPGNGS
jgi:hypothetical protein